MDAESEYNFSSYTPNDQDPISLVFTKCHEELKETRKLREDLRHWTQDIERLTDILKSVLTEVHSVHFKVEKVTEKATVVLYDLQNLFQRLETQVFGCTEELSYIWQGFLSKLSSSCILLRFVQTGELATKPDVAAMIGIGASIEAEVRIFLDVESYLVGILDISDELTRYAILGTGIGQLSRPQRVSEFLNKLYQGFTRIEKTEKMYKKMVRFDNDMKRLERVIFEMAIRNVGKNSQSPSAPPLPLTFNDLNIEEGSASAPDNPPPEAIKATATHPTVSNLSRSSTPSTAPLESQGPVIKVHSPAEVLIQPTKYYPPPRLLPVRDPPCRYGGLESRLESYGKLMRSCPLTLLHRELGLLKGFSGTDHSVDSYVLERELGLSRGPTSIMPCTSKRKRSGSDTAGQRKRISATPRAITTASANALFIDFQSQRGVGGGKSVIVVDDYIFLRNTDSYECRALEPQELSLKTKYQISADSNWKDWAVAYPPNTSSGKGGIRRCPTLFVLEGSGRRLKAFILDTGKITYEQFLDENIKFGDADFSVERQELSVQAVKASLPQHLTFDGILVDVRDPGSPRRWQMLKSATSASVEQIAHLIFLNSGTRVEICDFSKTLKEAALANQEQVITSKTPIGVTHLVKEKPEVLLSIRTKNSYFDMSHAGFPPHYITSMGRDTGQFKVYDSSSDDGQVENHELLRLDPTSDENTVSFHPDDSPRLIIMGRSCLRVVSIQRRANSAGYGKTSTLVQEFHAVFNGRNRPRVLIPKNEQAIVPLSNGGSNMGSGGRPGRRASVAVKSYFEDLDVLICQEYCESLDMLLVMEITDLDLKFYFFDNQSWNLLKSLTNLNLVAKPIDIIQPGIFSVSYSTNKITVRRNKSESDNNPIQLIIIPLLMEIST